MGCCLSTPEFYHPDLLAVLRCDARQSDRAKPWHNAPLVKIAPQLKAPERPHSADWSRRQSKRPRDLDWSRNSPVANELVDILNGALKDMGGWPIFETYECWCCFKRSRLGSAPPQMVEAFKKVCQQVNEAKLFNMGLQCRAGLYKIHVNRGGNIGVAIEF